MKFQGNVLLSILVPKTEHFRLEELFFSMQSCLHFFVLKICTNCLHGMKQISLQV